MVEAAKLTATLLDPANDSLGAFTTLADHARAVRSDLLEFTRVLDSSLAPAKEAIQRVANETGALLEAALSGGAMRQGQIRTALIKLAALEGEVTYLLRDNEQSIRGVSERAFEHLRRSIVADRQIRARWLDAYSAGEVACERLGAVHLLGHGIWAFKANADGGRTDLVYQDRLSEFELVERTATGLILTEWKRLPDGDNSDKLFDQARQQAHQYAAGILAGIELRNHRYAVLVTKHQVVVPNDLQVGSVTYRHICIPVDPHVPSIVSKALGKPS
jgi:hypothetical protein